MVKNNKLTNGLDRRTYLGGIAAGAVAGLAGCTDSEDDGLEVLHGWTGGDGAAAIETLIEAFKEEHSDIDGTFEPVGGDGNVELNTAVLQRLTNENPMSSFANWPGNNLKRYEGVLMDLEEDVWEAEGLKENMQERAVELCTYNDKMPAVPIGSHRMNNLFYNTAAFDEAGIDAESLESMSDLMDALETIDQDTDYIPFAHGMRSAFLGLQTWVQILSSQSGVDSYTDFIEGNGDRDAVVDALETLQEIQENYISDDASSIGYTQAAQKLIAGEAACIHGGNWQYGMYRSDDYDFEFGEDWDWIPFPGTEGTYFYHLDSFVVPDDNPSSEETIEWQKFIGTAEAQVEFNNLKGSVPLRTDIEPDELTDFLAITYEDLLNSEEYPPTLAHGLAVEPKQQNDCEGAIGDHFMDPYDADAAADALLDAVSK
ncbi:carbohydrate ABC transporter substrate-binding protein (plasmid) [Haloterrigena salifodinae]|uniref:Carbohydrate ABC transporter substrate-binding protein n=1 Tax=Haloterrigena salifodinae TaxID=2675099 RepID=A0A8T8E8F4_9EURY|nr:ABC transporter substrate-binding protein [Haloterrigena salifodinae]QRV17907.1 carbohydrate ABC transporter substrate-binding protein [Haloterrigena salifodinae]